MRIKCEACHHKYVKKDAPPIGECPKCGSEDVFDQDEPIPEPPPLPRRYYGEGF